MSKPVPPGPEASISEVLAYWHLRAEQEDPHVVPFLPDREQLSEMVESLERSGHVMAPWIALLISGYAHTSFKHDRITGQKIPVEAMIVSHLLRKKLHSEAGTYTTEQWIDLLVSTLNLVAGMLLHDQLTDGTFSPEQNEADQFVSAMETLIAEMEGRI